MQNCKKCGMFLRAVTELQTYEVRPPLVDVPEERKLPGVTRYECPNCESRKEWFALFEKTKGYILPQVCGPTNHSTRTDGAKWVDVMLRFHFTPEEEPDTNLLTELEGFLDALNTPRGIEQIYLAKFERCESGHDWIHDGDGALYCSRCKTLDPYSNETEG